jgi:hypothetical protein
MGSAAYPDGEAGEIRVRRGSGVYEAYAVMRLRRVMVKNTRRSTPF